MPYAPNTTQSEGKIDFDAIHKAKVAMMTRFMDAKAEAERKGEVTFTPV